MLNFYDLFAGIGGFRLGLERCGSYKCVGSCEIDKYAREVYKKNFGDYPTETDIRSVDASKLPDFDILTAGFPCQAFSFAGKRLGFNDTRGTLFFEIARIAKQKRPKILFLENVKGLLNHDRGKTFGTIINTLYELGYDTIEWQVINGKYFVPQNRERVFIIGHLRDKPTRKIFPIIKKNGYIEGETKRKERQKHEIVNCIDSNYWKGIDNYGQRTAVAIPIKYMGRNQRTVQENIFPTIDTVQSNGLYDGYRYRKLTPLECERLMGFPDNWTQGGHSDTQRYKMLGNAVIPAIIEMIGKELISIM